MSPETRCDFRNDDDIGGSSGPRLLFHGPNRAHIRRMDALMVTETRADRLENALCGLRK